jgi:uncharacterized protein YdiU (UPF0061 family)
MTDITIVPATTETVPSIINWNYDEIKTKLSEFLKKYDGYVVRETTLPEDKKLRAELNKVTKNIEEFRKTVKKEISKPIDAFEEQCKELSGMVVDVAGKIDKTVKEHEDKKKEENRKIAQEIIKTLTEKSELPSEYASRVEFRESFTNLTTTKSQIEKDVTEQIEVLKAEVNQFLENTEIIKTTLESANKRIKTKLFLDDYVSQLKYKSISEIVSLINTRTEQIEASEVVVEKPVEVFAEPVMEAKPVEVKPIETPQVGAKAMVVTLEITSTKQKLELLKEFLTINGISYKKI